MQASALQTRGRDTDFVIERRRPLLAVLVIAQVLTVANANMIAVALPPLARDLGASETQQQWVVDAYVLVFAALLVAGGVLGDRYGRRRALTAGLVLFAGGSLACALAPGPGSSSRPASCRGSHRRSSCRRRWRSSPRSTRTRSRVPGPSASGAPDPGSASPWVRWSGGSSSPSSGGGGCSP